MDQWFSTTNTQANNVRSSEIFGHSFLKENGGGVNLGEKGEAGSSRGGETVVWRYFMSKISIFNEKKALYVMCPRG